ncbi:hypothetical protein RHSIM_Rhsim13G0172000 [Rhododendron simsii]|uniref:F-box domain-containing protein n=1 Tax=Rhododendron simsii TaxID=118357 RepID=A0A834G0C5_RHOSS|nr:hypothetical protein RHSIM_Rhsim13G0172000 [Rhododendron simsii]
MSSPSNIDPNAIDIISELPESLLLHLLSFLPLEDAVKTQVLSKRWEYLWTHLTSLVFRLLVSDFSDKYVGDFVTFVDRTLFLNSCSKLKKFSVQFAYEPQYASNIDLWTRFAAEKKGVEELLLDFFHEYFEVEYLLPQHLYNNSSFKALKFSVCTVMPKGVVCWNSLKKLTIGWVNLSEDVIQKILVGSPVLEILELYYFYGFNRLHVSNANVKKLILRNVWDRDEEEEEEYRFDEYHSVLVVSAPHLHSLEILGGLSNKFCRLEDISSLVDANLNFCPDIYSHGPNDDYDRYPKMLTELLQSIVHVKKITLGTFAIQDILNMLRGKEVEYGGVPLQPPVAGDTERIRMAMT